MPGTNAIVSDNPGAADLLASSKAAAEQALKASGMPSPETVEPMPPSAPRSAQAIPAGGPPSGISYGAPPGPSPEAMAAAQGGQGENVVGSEPPISPAPTQTPQAPGKPKLFTGAWSEIGNGIMQGFAQLDRMAAQYMNFANKGMAIEAGADLNQTLNGPDQTGAAINKFVDDAIKTWKPSQPTGAGAQALGQAATMVPALLTGPAAEVILPAQSASVAYNESTDQGQDWKTASILALTAAATTAAGMKLPLKNPSLIKRLAIGAGINTPLNAASEYLTKLILKSRGYQDAADQINPLDPKSLFTSGIMGAIFGALAGKGTPKETPANTPAPAPEPSPEATAAATPPSTEPVTPAPAPPAAPIDQPTAEPMKDLRAQLVDMKDPKTARTGVLLSTDTLTGLPASKGNDALSVKSQLASAQKTGRVVDVPQGKLIVKTPELAEQARAALTAGTDPQQIVGQHTGAGSGKAPDQTHVVQGHTPEGAVATESMVTPEEIPAAVQKTAAEGNTPVITTPEEAITRRQTEIANEQATPAIEPEPTPEPESAAEPEPPTPKLGIYKPPSGDKEVAVHIEEGAPEGKIRVRQLNDEGQPSDRTVDVPAERVKQSAAPSEQTPPAKSAGEETQAPEVVKPTTEIPKPEAAPAGKEPSGVSSKKPRTALESLPEVLAQHESQEKTPAGQKFAAPLPERQDNASAFATVLKQAAKEAKAAGNVPDEAIQRANSAANAARGLTLKSAEATAKNQGTSHGRVTALVAELHKSARALLGKPNAGDEVIVKPKEAELKAKAVKKLEPPAPKPAPKKVRIAAEPVNPRADQLHAQRLQHEFVHADTDEEAAAKRTEIEQWLHDKFTDKYTPDQVSQVMEFLDKERADTKRSARTMGETVEDEEQEFEHQPEGMSTTYRPSLVDQIKTKVFNKRLDHEWQLVADQLHDAGVFDRLRNATDTGKPMGAQEIFGHIFDAAGRADAPFLRNLFSQLVGRIPDVPVYSVSAIKPLRGPKAGQELGGFAGMFHGPENAIQVSLAQSRTKAFAAQSLLHEMLHGATFHELNTNSVFARSMEAARSIFEKRMRAKYGNQTIDEHLTFFNGRDTQIPDFYMRHLYGMVNSHEMISEIYNDPNFIREVAESEKYAQPGENLPEPKAGLLRSIMSAIGKLFGINDPKLLQHIMHSSIRVMDAQRGRLGFLLDKTNLEFHNDLPEQAKNILHATPIEIEKAEPGLRNLRTEPEPLRGVDEGLGNLIRGAGDEDDEALNTARAFKHTVVGKSLDGVRKVVIALKTMQQIFTDHLNDFGGDRPDNPLRMLQEQDAKRSTIMSRMSELSKPAVEAWKQLTPRDNIAVGKLMRDTTMWKIDPRLSLVDQVAAAQKLKGFNERYAEFKARWDKLSDAAKTVYTSVESANKAQYRSLRRAGVDTALDSLGLNLSDAQKSLLYGAKTPKVYDTLIGKDKLIDVGENNDKLVKSLRDFGGQSELDGPYFHLGRPGDYVVQIKPEGTKTFSSQAEANNYARQIHDLSPGSRAKVSEREGQWAVDYKAQYVSMHPTRGEAEAEQSRLQQAGFETGQVTQKTLGKESAPLSSGMTELMASAERKINRDGEDEGTQALVSSLRSAFLQITAARSAYSGSRLARKGFGGVRPQDMRQNFAEHALSTMWHTSQIRTVFDKASALAKLRGMARDSFGAADQDTLYRRGEVASVLGKHMLDEAQNYGNRPPFNSMLAKLGFANYLASPAHAAIWMTQNFTAGIPVAGPRWGYGKATAAFYKSMKLVSSPALRSTLRAVFSLHGSAEDINNAILTAIRNDKDLGKWAAGTNSHMRQLLDQGVISHSYSAEMSRMAQGGNQLMDRVMDWARLMPAMADSFNRVTTALAGLEMTGGDLRKTADFVQEIHADYSYANKPLAFKKLSHVAGGSMITMFKTYAQNMIHLVYGSFLDSFRGGTGGSFGFNRQAAATFAGLLVGNAVFTGLYGALGLEPLRLALYAYHKIADAQGETWDLQNAIHTFLVNHLGKTAGNIAAGGLPHLFGIDVQNRMGLADLFFHNPPDLLSSDRDAWKNFVFDQSGPMVQEVANGITSFASNMQHGHPFQAISSVIPVKAFQDSAKALSLLNTGKQNSIGGQMTQPSVVDAMIQAFGFKPAGVAEAQEREGVRVEMQKNIKSTKTDLIKQYVTTSGEDRIKVRTKINEFNQRNPAEAIRGRDILPYMRYQRNDNRPGRDTKINAATKF